MKLEQYLIEESFTRETNIKITIKIKFQKHEKCNV